MARPVRFERTTSCSGGTEQSITSDQNKELTESDSSACTNACTRSQDGAHGDHLEAIAEAIRSLPPEAQQQLLQMLSEPPEKKKL